MTQVEYIAILFNDLNFTSPQSKDWLERRHGTRWSDELSTIQKHAVIEALKAMKEEKVEVSMEDEEGY